MEFERQAFREARGLVTADGARAFLAFAAALTILQIAALDAAVERVGGEGEVMD